MYMLYINHSKDGSVYGDYTTETRSEEVAVDIPGAFGLCIFNYKILMTKVAIYTTLYTVISRKFAHGR